MVACNFRLSVNEQDVKVAMNQLRVDLYSDTQSRPTAQMRRYMLDAEVGDEQRGEDPSVTRLCEMVADLLGKEAAIFLPSGTMCNEIAYRVHCEPGDEIIVDKTGHALHFETGGPAALSGVMTRPLDGVRGIFSAEQVRAAIRRPGRHDPASRLLSVENTSNLGGGTVWPIERIGEVTAVAREAGLRSHLDGARLMNAVVASGIPARDYAAPFDSVWICLTKGLAAPVGAVLAGSDEFIGRAWRFKHQFGGAMRQAGMIAAAGIYALEHHVERLAEDHDNARRFAELIAEIPGIHLDLGAVQTNMVYFDTGASGLSAPQVNERLLARGVRIGDIDNTLMRAVTHIDVDRAGVEEAARVLREVVKA
jgi:threonine aldolase